MPGETKLAFEPTAKRKARQKLPQVGEINTPPLMDTSGKCLLYYESGENAQQKWDHGIHSSADMAAETDKTIPTTDTPL